MDHASTNSTGAGPPPASAPGMSVEAEASLMNRGRSRQLFAFGGGLLLLLGAGGMLLQRITRDDEFEAAAVATARIERDHFEAFFSCALPGTRPSQLSAQRVHSELENLGERQGKSYGKTLEGCLPQMQALQASVQALEMPADVSRQQAGLVAAADTLEAANAKYLRYLADRAQAYDYVVAMPLLEKFGLAWAGYQSAQADLQHALREQQ